MPTIVICGGILLSIIGGFLLGYHFGHCDGRQFVACEVRSGKFDDHLTDLIYQRLKKESIKVT